ncbi:hypothetical protein GCM10025867_48140 (plasmid) [Frondihabitans sucicola]|uniref:Methyltransferase type 11 domain-containing protein n=1 Tax=Frondihabitans sucicola TaxID=1268041 RepID=A0ABM8GVX7_9MICO|nr:methyltransferase domain-containing protein [Frondihabitans sucicola]BDZ52573.1 hypothetical protein GCM10025867_48140 [Frondihabitans sucicola]
MTETARRENPARRALLALETLRVLTEAGPTAVQRERLLDWPGWGALAPAFSPQPKSGWLDVADRLEQSFSDRPGDLKTAADHLDTSFFTPPEIIEAMFGLLRASGFTGGSVFEPGCGSGRFMAHAPSDLAIDWTGVEIDPTAARIARVLNPKAQIITSALQDISLRAGAFDVAIGNVPFAGRGSVYDPAYGTSTSLHGYFMLRAFDAVRVGGLVLIITSRNVMDSAQMIEQAQRIGDLVGAVRLPSGAFSASGTEVVTDLVVFQKRDAQLPPDLALHDAPSAYNPYGASPRRMTITAHADPAKAGVPVSVNAYWGQHPEHVAGRMAVTGYPQSPLVVLSTDHDGDIARAMAALRGLMPALPPRSTVAPEFGDVILTDDEGRKEGSFHIADDEVHQVISGALVQLPRAPQELRSLITLRDASLALIEAESDPARSDESITPLRDLARGAYLDYADKFGALNRGALHEGAVDPETGLPALSYKRPTMGGFRQDPDYVTVLAMEEFDQEIGEAAPAPILVRRVNKTPDRATSASSATEALSIVRGEGRGLDLARIGDLIGEPDPQVVVDQLAGHIFRSPTSDDYVLAVDYLSGNVRQKLADAQRAAETDPAFSANVEALRAVMPADLGPLDIRVSLGAPWIKPAYIVKFVQEVFLGRVKVTYTAPISYWELTNESGDLSPDITLTWGTPDANPLRLLELALNGKAPVITEEVLKNGKLKKVKRPAQTMAAEAKQSAIQERFAEWVWEDAARTEAICHEYNQRFSSYVVRKPDGAHLTFPGMSEDFTLWPHQRNAIDGMVSNARFMVGHAVGAGKTTDMVAGAMTLRRFGLANKPMIAVPNHLLEQVAREAKQLYPTGKFLIAGREDLQGSGRRLFAARCATGSWDAVILTHQALVSLPVAPEVEEAWIEEKKADLRSFLQDDKASGSTGGKRGAKLIAQAIRRLDAQLAELRDNANTDKNMILFEHLGVDHISIDEVHAFKRLPIATRAEGFSSARRNAPPTSC